MSQSITALTTDNLICMVETNNGVSENVLFRIICPPETNPYGNDRFLVVREYATGTGSGESALKFNTTSTNVEYENSNLDTFNSNEYYNRFDDATKACILTSSIICYNYAEGASYTLARQIFSLSNKELGGTYETDESVPLGYFTSNALRKTLNKAGTAASVWARSPASASTVCCVNNGGHLGANSPANGYSARPAFNLSSSCLISSEPNEDGSYNLLPDADIPYKTAGFTALLGVTETMPVQVKVECEAVYDRSISVSVCNNYKDTEPTWEPVTLGQAHNFTNTSKTADTWAVGVKLKAESESNITIYEPAAIVICEEAT